MPEAVRHQFVERTLTDMTEGSMAQIVPESDGFGQILIQAETARQRAGHLGNLQRMGEAGAVMIPFRGKKDLRFEFQAAEGFAMDNTIPVPLEGGAQIAGLHGPLPPGGFGGVSRVRRKKEIFLLLKTLPNGQENHLLSAEAGCEGLKRMIIPAVRIFYIPHPREKSFPEQDLWRKAFRRKQTLFLHAHALDKRGEKVNNAIQKKNHEVTGR
jgi:hypothetical protein